MKVYDKILSESEAFYSINYDTLIESGGAQACYNLPKEFFEYACDNNILIESEMNYHRKGSDGNAYILNDEYRFELGEGILWLIDEKDNKNHEFIASINGSNGKPQFHKTTYNGLGEKYQWFCKLYRKNLSGNQLIFEIDENRKILKIDVKFNAVKPNISKEEITETDFNMKFEYNRIFFGAPGTGKSYTLNEEKNQLLKGFEDNFERVTFHPDYSYAHFVGTYKPVPIINEDNKEEISYKYIPGPFIRILVEALNHYDDPYLLIIEEINRANVAAVFGDIFQLLDRDAAGKSEFPIQASEDLRDYLKKEVIDENYDYTNISIPSNLYIWTTMNSADQGVYAMDTAFKRRWEFTYVPINNSEEKIEDVNVIICDEKINWNLLRTAINIQLLAHDINEDKLIGPFFIPLKYLPESPEDNSKFIEIFKNKLLMYLFEDVSKSRGQFLFDNKVTTEVGYKFVYSRICEEFDKKGIHIFSDEIVQYYYGLEIKENNSNYQSGD